MRISEPLPPHRLNISVDWLERQMPSATETPSRRRSGAATRGPSCRLRYPSRNRRLLPIQLKDRCRSVHQPAIDTEILPFTGIVLGGFALRGDERNHAIDGQLPSMVWELFEHLKASATGAGRALKSRSDNGVFI